MLIGESQVAIFKRNNLDIRVTCSPDARLNLRVLGYEFEEQREEVERLLPELKENFHATFRSRGEKEILSYWGYGDKGRKARKTFLGVDDAWSEFQPPEGWTLVAVVEK